MNVCAYADSFNARAMKAGHTVRFSLDCRLACDWFRVDEQRTTQQRTLRALASRGTRDAQVSPQCGIAVGLVRADSTEQESSVAFGTLFWSVAPGQMVPGITEGIGEEDADRGYDQRLYVVGQDRLEAGSQRALSGMWVRWPKQQA